MSFPSDNARRSELHGISGPGQINGTGKRDREYDEIPKNSWKKKPTMIQTPKPGGVPNPYDRRVQTRNPTARAVIAQNPSNGLRPPPQKRQKYATDIHNPVATTSKFFTEHVSTSMSAHNGFGLSIDARPSNLWPSVLPALKERTTTFDVFSPNHPISILDDNDNEDIGIPMERKSSGDELDVINLVSANSSMTIADDLDVSISRNEHPFERQSPPRASSSRGVIRDGPSTQRLRKQFEGRGSRPRSPMSSVSSRVGSPAPPETVDVDEIEDFEDVDLTCGAIHRPPSIGAIPHVTKRATSPKGLTTFPLNNVQTKRQMFETKPTAPVIDLKTIQPKKGLTTGMKPKSGRQALKIEQKVKDQQPSHNARTGSRKDKVATSSTSYLGGSDLLALPLEVCVWGSQIFEIDPQTAVNPGHWLLWNKVLNELQLVEHPVVLNPHSKQSVVGSVKFDKLQNCTLEISQEDANPFIAVRFRDNVRGLSDDVLHTGLAFKFQSSHANTRANVATLRSELMKLCDSSPHSLVGSAVDRCLDMYRRVGPAGLRSNNDTSSARDVEAVKTMISKGMYAAPLTEEARTVGRPRPAYGKNAAALPTEPRRRSARLAPESPPLTSSSNLDEVVLVYPHSGPGALNITNSDMKRLEPSEFLNDTLIELGLKFLMNDIRERDPELANEIHVFSTFFYKKLNHKNFKEGYNSVRKWTAKVDLFKKKYVIVPINENIHWYLAIIYRPEFVLDEAPTKPASRASKRISNVDVLNTAVDEDKEVSHACSLDSMDSTRMSDRSQSPATIRGVEGESVVDRVVESTRLCSIHDENDEPYEPQHSRSDSPELGDDFNESCTPNNVLGYVEGGGRPTSADSDASPSNSEDEEVDQLLGDDENLLYPPPESYNLSLISGQPSSDVASNSADMQNEPMDVDSPVISNSLLKDTEMHAGQAELSNHSLLELDDDNSSASGNEDSSRGGQGSQGSGSAVPTTAFYHLATAAARGILSSETVQVEPCPSDADLAAIETEESEEEKDNDATETSTQNERQTWIFTFDSLGSGHDKARKLLDRYLRAEAQDKMHVENPSVAKGRTAVVPTQPNYCDCGLYLLHFARTFLSDPDRFKHVICTSKRNQEASRRAKLWQGDQVASMRREMRERIRKESEIYKKIKAEKESQKKEAAGDSAKQANAVESSDDEIIVGEISRRQVSPAKRGKKANGAATVASNRTSAPVSKEKKATRLRG